MHEPPTQPTVCSHAVGARHDTPAHGEGTGTQVCAELHTPACPLVWLHGAFVGSAAYKHVLSAHPVERKHVRGAHTLVAHGLRTQKPLEHRPSSVALHGHGVRLGSAW